MIDNASPSHERVVRSDSYRELKEYLDQETGEIVLTDHPEESFISLDDESEHKE